MAIARFDAGHISDHKRLVRGEQLLLARTVLRERDRVHHRPWNVLTLAGGAPTGEVQALRALMPKCRILAVDRDPACLEAAIDAGVNDVVQCDLTAWATVAKVSEWMSYDGKPMRAVKESEGPPLEIVRRAPFDILNLDLCSVACEETRPIMLRYMPLLAAGGAMIFTFAYGRDVVEGFNAIMRKAAMRNPLRFDRFRAAGVPDRLIGRIAYLATIALMDRIRSIMTYRGNEMPMCSILLTKGEHYDGLSYVQVEPGDFELAVTEGVPDPALLYDCPQIRIDAIRRRHAALKASLTRAERGRKGLLPFPGEAEP